MADFKEKLETLLKRPYFQDKPCDCFCDPNVGYVCPDCRLYEMGQEVKKMIKNVMFVSRDGFDVDDLYNQGEIK